MVHVLVDHRRVICSLTFVLKLWLDHVDARRKSFQVYVNLRLQELSSILTLSTVPWHSMVAVRCQVLLSRPESSAWVRLRSLLSRRSVPPSQGPGQSMCALVLRGVCTSWTSGHLPLTTPGFMTSARIASPASRGPSLSWDSRRTLQKSPPNEFDCHAPSSRGSFRPCITMYSTLVCPRHTYRRHPLHQWSSCLLSSTTRSCMDSSRVVWQLYLS